MARNDKIHEFCQLPNYRVPRVTGRSKRPPSQKPCAIAHENGQKLQNSRVLSTSKLSCSRGHGPLKSSPEPKTVCYSPQKRPKMTKSNGPVFGPFFIRLGRQTDSGPSLSCLFWQVHPTGRPIWFVPFFFLGNRFQTNLQVTKHG